MTRRIKTFVTLLALLLATSCGGTLPWEKSGRWENPGVSEEQWSKDRSACRRLATTAAEREYVREHIYLGRGDFGTADTFETRMARYDAGKRSNRLFGDCMTRRGSSQTRGKGGK